MMTSYDLSSTEGCLKVWRDRILHSKKKELSPSELCSYFQNPDLQQAFFRFLDRDENGAISLEEWTGCFSKLVGDNTDPQILTWFVQKFESFEIEGDDSPIYLNEQQLFEIVSDVEFGYRFAGLISPKARRVNTLHLLTSLEIIASMSTDAKWLSWLKYQFTDAMQKSGRLASNEMYITLGDFMNNFQFKEPFLAQRLFAYMDKDGSGTLSLHEFINGLEVVVNGTQEEKIQFLFRVFDIDGDGSIDFDEMRMMLKCCLEDTPSLDKDEAIDDLTAVLFKDCDADDSGTICFDELRIALKRNEALFKALSVSTSIWIKPKFIHKKKKTRLMRMRDMIVNRRATLIFWSAYLLINLACMLTAFFTYYGNSPWLVTARVMGNSLNFNCAFILVLVLRKHFTWIREKGGCAFLPIDDFIEIHKIVGIVILIETLIHTFVHLINLYNVCADTGYNYLESLFTWKITIGFPTGIIDLVLFIVILIFSMPYVRNHGFFQLFYWIHTLTIPFLLIMLLHGKVFYKWLIVPGFCYAVEKILRYRKIRSNKFGDTLITEAYVLPSKVVHLVVRKPPKFRFQPGDYVFVNIPVVAKYEWHPFSISSAPEKSDFIWLHIRACGNWTKKLLSYASSPKFEMNNSYIHRSLTRVNMRAHMSKMMNDSALTVSAAVRSKAPSIGFLDIVDPNNHFNPAPGMPKKTVSFETHSQIMKIMSDAAAKESSAAPPQSPPQLQQATAPTSETDSNKPMHKGILKSTMLEYNGGSSITSDQEANMSGNGDGEFPNQSTPKASLVEDPQQQQQQQKQQQSTEETKTEQTKQTEPVEVARGGSASFSEANVSVNLNSNTSKEEKVEPMQIMDTVDNKQTGFNVGDYFQSKQNKLEKPVQIVINLEQDCELLKKCPKEDYEDCQEIMKTKSKFDFKNDALGYMKMYNRTARVTPDTVGLDQLWRLKVLIDGPYGTPSQHIFDSEHAVLIASGIGITPFASILQSLMYRYRRAKSTCPHCGSKLCEEFIDNNDKMDVRKVDFIWITREQRSLEWFISILSQMEIEQRKNGDEPLFLETHLYVTSAKRQSDLRTIGLHITLDAILSQEESNLVNGLKQRTHYGRPNWDIVMQSLIRKQKGKITVFYCGLPSLANVLNEKCHEYGLNFKKEIF